MKQIVITTLSLIIWIKIFANPIPTPSFNISELYFTTENQWVLEVAYYEADSEFFTIDSVWIFSSQDSIKLILPELSGHFGLFLIESENLPSSFNLNRYGDLVLLRTFISMEWEVFYIDDFVKYGNYSNAIIGYPRIGQSLSSFSYFFAKDNSPTLNTQNDTTGVMGTLMGTLYYNNSVPVTNRLLKLDFPFRTSETGTYTTRVYSRPTSFNRIYYPVNGYFSHSVGFNTINYVMEPDSVIERDIHLVGNLPSGINSYESGNPIKFYPNPVSSSSKLNYEINLPTIAGAFRIELTTTDGKLLLSKKIDGTKGELDLFGATGLVLANLWMRNRLISTSRIVVTNE
jgi:hypothetical protein